jgi:hypothetical protein
VSSDVSYVIQHLGTRKDITFRIKISTFGVINSHSFGEDLDATVEIFANYK